MFAWKFLHILSIALIHDLNEHSLYSKINYHGIDSRDRMINDHAIFLSSVSLFQIYVRKLSSGLGFFCQFSVNLHLWKEFWKCWYKQRTLVFEESVVQNYVNTSEKIVEILTWEKVLQKAWNLANAIFVAVSFWILLLL